MKVYIMYEPDGYVTGWSITPSQENCFEIDYDENSHLFKHLRFYKIENNQAVFDEEEEKRHMNEKAFLLKKPEYEAKVKEYDQLINLYRDEKELELEPSMSEKEYKELLKKRTEVVTLLKKGSEL